MAQQGIEYTPEQKQVIVNSLRPYLELGFSRRKSCHFIGFEDATLSLWLKADNALLTQIVAWENVNNAIALANIHQALQNEKILTTEKGDVRVDNSWKLISKLEDGYKDKLDVTSNNETVAVAGFEFVKNKQDETKDSSNG